MLNPPSAHIEYGNVILAFVPVPSTIPFTEAAPIIGCVFSVDILTCRICFLVWSNTIIVFLSFVIRICCTNPSFAFVPIPLLLPDVIGVPIAVDTCRVNTLKALIVLPDVSGTIYELPSKLVCITPAGDTHIVFSPIPSK